MKVCRKCGTNKVNKAFNKHKASKDGLQSYCRDCQKVANDKLRAAAKRAEKTDNGDWRKPEALPLPLPEKAKESPEQPLSAGVRIVLKHYIGHGMWIAEEERPR